MKNLKLLNNLIYKFLVTIFFSTQLIAVEPTDIWEGNSEIKIESSEEIQIDAIEEEKTDSIFEEKKISETNIFQVENEDLDFNKVYGLFDPEENDLTLEIWIESDGQILLEHLKRIEKISLSKDSEELLIKILFTNSYLPIKNINSLDFLDYKLEWLIKKDKINIMEEFLVKNPDIKNNNNLLKYLINKKLSKADINSACEKIKYFNKETNDNYLLKFKIYCLIYQDNLAEAQLHYDLLGESGYDDDFYNNKINYLLGYTEEMNDEVSDKNLFNFYLSHIVNSNFQYDPSRNTTKYIWQYLSSSNLLIDPNSIDLEDENKFNLYEWAAASGSYDKKGLFDIYGKFLFSFDQFLNAEEIYQTLSPYKARALIYQSTLLSDNLEKKFKLLVLLNNLFKKDNIEKAFSEELSLILSNIEEENVPLSYLGFYQTKISLSQDEKIDPTSIKFDNKILHRSKLLKYFIEDNYNVEKLEGDLINIYKKIKKNKKYYYSAKDVILLDSLKADGVQLPKKLEKKYTNNQLTVPRSLMDLSDKGQTGLVLLKIIEIIGEDELKDLDPETLYFITATLNKLDLKKLRNNIIIKTLPLRV
tara:strand:+ start:429 stop:2192 length:1764 start_codon:yes stop_codon:yes gene_type:complete